MNYNAKTKAIMNAMKFNKCQLPQISCECCPESGGGSFNPTSKNIRVCYNKATTEGGVIGTIVHELVHAYDDCIGIDWANCDERACTEIRAVDASGKCAPGGGFRRANESYRECNKRVAADATSADKSCGDGTSAVNNVFNECFANKTPYQL